MVDAVSGMDLTKAQDCSRVFEWLADLLWNVPTRQLIDRYDQRSFEEAGVPNEVAKRLSDSMAAMDDAAIHEAAIDYTGLFASYREEAPHPYESVYSTPDRMAMMPVRDEVVGIYADANYQPLKTEDREPEDHVSHELRFCGWLLDQGKPEECRAFVDDHLSKWIPRFASEVRSQAALPLYPAATEALVSLVA